MATKIDRAVYHRALTDGEGNAWSELKAEAKATGLPMEVLLRKKTKPAESGSPANVLLDYMSREDMYPEPSWTKAALTVGDCINTPFRANLLFSYWDKVFHNAIWGHHPPQTFAQTNDELVPGSIYRPYAEGREVVNRARRTPQIVLNDIIASVITQTDDMVRGNGFTVDGGLETLMEIPEGGDFPEISFTLDQTASGMKKVGFSLTNSRESKFREQYVQTTNRVIEQVADLQAIAMTNEALKLIYDARDTTVNPDTSVTEDIDGLIDIVTDSENGYARDTAVMARTQFRAMARALLRLSSSTTEQALPTDAEGRLPGFFGANVVLNDIQRVMRWGYLNEANRAAIGIPAGNMLTFPVGTTLDMYQQANGMVDEEAYMVKTQDWTRVISMIYGFKVYDRNGIKIYTT